MMRITVKQLKHLVREAAGDASRDLEMMKVNFVNALRARLLASADASDPTIDASGGMSVWEAQVDEAMEEFEARLDELLDSIDQDLMNGEFYMGPGTSPQTTPR